MLVRLLCVFLGIACLWGLWTEDSYWACLVQSLAVVVGFWALVGFVVAAYIRWRENVIVWSCVLLSVVYWVRPSNKKEFCATEPIQIIQANVYQFNPNRKRCLEEIFEKQADVLILHEISQSWLADLELLNYPYKMIEIVPDSVCCYGMAIFSKFPLRGSLRFYSEGIAVLKATILNYLIVTTHFRNPSIYVKYRSSVKQMADLSQFLNDLSGNRIFAGDFNCVPWDSRMRRFLQKTGLKDTREGIWATYRSNLPVLPIDYVLIDSGLYYCKTETFSLWGSDHLAIKTWIGEK